jgi:Pyruvate/2-oxoacid:ferredoxin oxidoreductase delta subunit
MLGIPEVRATRCVRYRYRYSECRRCADACPHDAVRLSDEGVGLDPARCQGCALCTVACRTEALVPANLPRIDLLRQAAGKPRFSFACAPSGLAADALVPCLGALDAGTFAYLVSRGVAVDLRGSAHCGECEHGAKGAEQLALNLDALEVLRRAAGSENWAAVALTAPAVREQGAKVTDHRPSRRQFLRRVAGKGVQSVTANDSPQPAPLKAVRAARAYGTSQRELLQSLWPPQSAQGDALESHPALPVADLALKPGCTRCEACARVCPTGALQVTESTLAWSLEFQFSRCVGCGVCAEACQPDVLVPRESAAAATLAQRSAVKLLALPKRRCARCDRFFVAADAAELCPVCSDDDRDFAAVFG